MSSRSLLLLPLALSALPLLSGCSQLRTEAGKFWNHLQAMQAQEKAEPATQAESSPSPSTHAAKPANIHQIVALLEDGKYDTGRRQLHAYLKRHPDDTTARSLLHQLEVDPEKALGPAARQYTVRPGDTLGELAARYLGSPLKFLILARYNHIKRSKDLRVGQTLRLPASSASSSSPSSQEPTQASKPPKATGSSQGATTGSAQASQPEPKTQATKPVPKKGDLLGKREEKALKQQAIGLNAMHKHYNAVAYQAFQRALAIDPDLEPAKSESDKLGKKLVRQYHEEALAAYRDQKLNRAIALWNKALAINPNYEPALGYRARALELEHRLKQLEQDSSSK